MLPTDVLPPAQARILVALLRVYERDGRATVRAVALEAGRSVSVTHSHLHELAEAGLVAGLGPEIQGALHPTVGMLVAA